MKEKAWEKEREKGSEAAINGNRKSSEFRKKESISPCSKELTLRSFSFN